MPAERCQKFFPNIQTSINPIIYEGVGPDHQIIDRNSKTVLSSTSNLGNFLFLSIRQILAEFKKNRLTRGVAAVVFEMRHPEKLNL